MHFAYPPRKSSSPPPFRPRSARLPLPLPLVRRTRLRTIFLVVLGLLACFYLLTWPGGETPYREPPRSGKPPVVIVTVLDPSIYDQDYLKIIRENRLEYAAKQGYEAFVVNVHDYDTHGAPSTWAKILAARHAVTKFPDCNWIWILDQDALVMDATKRLEDHVLNANLLDGFMIRDHPVVPPDSIIKSFAYLRGEDANLIVAQDKDGLVSDSVLIRNGDWAKFFLETWLDPLYRSYNFQKAERHALEHIVQWHVTVLSKLAIVPQSIVAPYSRGKLGQAYTEGDYVVLLAGCQPSGIQSCAAEVAPYWQRWQAIAGE